MAALVDTNVLVYCYDRHDQQKQRIASELVDRGIAERSICISYQSIVEFYSVVTREIRGAGPLLDRASAARETEDLLTALDVLYPTELIVRTALRATATYQLSWWDAQILACGGQRPDRDHLRRLSAQPPVRARACHQSLSVAAARTFR